MPVILVIDDDTTVRTTIASMLRKARHTVTEACNGAKGVEKLAQMPHDIVITDILMPDQEGIETIRIIRRQTLEVGIIAISGGGVGKHVDFLQLAKEFGADATLAKPFTRRQLYDTVNGVLMARQERIDAVA